MIPVYAAVLRLCICFIDVGAWNINGLTFLTNGMVLANFWLKDKEEKTRFFQKNFMVANTAIEIVLGMLFLALSKVKINFAEQKLN